MSLEERVAVRNVIFPHSQHAAGQMPITFFEAVVTGLAIGSAQQAPAPHIETIRRGVVSMRPLLREGAREGVLAGCLFAYRNVSDAEIEQWLEFLRSDSGGRYARASASCTT